MTDPNLIDPNMIAASFGPMLFPLAGGGILGYASGKFIKLIFRILLFAIGGLVALLAFLQWKGYIMANFPLLEKDIISSIQNGSAQIAQMMTQVGHQFQTEGLIGTGVLGFTGGFILGLKH